MFEVIEELKLQSDNWMVFPHNYNKNKIVKEVCEFQNALYFY